MNVNIQYLPPHLCNIDDFERCAPEHIIILIY